MEHPRISGEEIDRRGYEHYETRIREAVETEENVGKIIVIDVETGDYEIAEDGLTAGRRLQAKHPNAAMLALRIGYDAVYMFGGVLPRRAEGWLTAGEAERDARQILHDNAAALYGGL